MQFCLRNSFDPSVDSYKYKISISIEKIRFNVSPNKCHEFLLQRWFVESHSYVQELKRFRPLVRLQTLIDARKQGKLSPKLEKIRKALVRDWFRLVLWYVRLKKAAQAGSYDGSYPQQLLELHLKYQIS